MIRLEALRNGLLRLVPNGTAATSYWGDAAPCFAN